MKIMNPATGEILSEVPETPLSDIAHALSRARKAQSSWNAKTLEERLAAIRRYHDLLERDAEVLAKIFRSKSASLCRRLKTKSRGREAESAFSSISLQSGWPRKPSGLTETRARN